MRNKWPFECVLVSLFSLLMSSCSGKPDHVLDEGKMVDVMTDMQMAEAYYSTSSGPKTYVDKETLKESVLQKHGVSQEDLDSTIAYYGRNIDDYFRLYGKVEQKIRERSQGALAEIVGSETDIWPYGSFAMLMANQASEGFTFSFPIPDVEPGTQLEWRFRVTKPEGVEAVFGVEYENGVSMVQKKNPGSSRSLSLALQTDTAVRAKRTFGFMTVPTSAMPLWVDSIRLVTIEFDSLTYNRIRSQKTIHPGVSEPKKTVQKTDTVQDSISIN